MTSFKIDSEEGMTSEDFGFLRYQFLGHGTL